MQQNNSTELLGYSFNNIYSKDAPPDPLDPKSVFFPIFLGFSIGNRSSLWRPGSVGKTPWSETQPWVQIGISQTSPLWAW